MFKKNVNHVKCFWCVVMLPSYLKLQFFIPHSSTRKSYSRWRRHFSFRLTDIRYIVILLRPISFLLTMRLINGNCSHSHGARMDFWFSDILWLKISYQFVIKHTMCEEYGTHKRFVEWMNLYSTSWKYLYKMHIPPIRIYIVEGRPCQHCVYPTERVSRYRKVFPLYPLTAKFYCSVCGGLCYSVQIWCMHT